MHFPVRLTSRRAFGGFNRFPAFFSMFILCRIRTVGNAAARFTAFIIYCCTVQVSYAQRREHQTPPVFAACFAEQYAQRAILSRRIDRFPVLFFRKTEFADGKLRIVFRSALFQRSAHRLQNSVPVCPKNAFRIRRLSVIFQPHLYTRTRDFAPEFAAALSLADEVLLLDIYPARELPIEGVTSELIFKDITCPNKALCKKEDLINTIKKHNFDVLLTAGAGDICNYLPEICKVLKQ